MKEKNIDMKIDGLSKTVNDLRQEITSGFSRTQNEIDDLARMVAQGFTDVHKEIHKVRGELHGVRDELKKDIVHLRGDVDIMLDKHIGIFRKDYDELAVRVKNLEQPMLTH